MDCLHPIWIKNNRKSYLAHSEYPVGGQELKGLFDKTSSSSIVPVPCGRCSSCRHKRGSSWRVRLIHENEFGGHSNSIFVTLTFSDRYYFKYQNNPARAIRLFLDRWRKRYRKSPVHWFVTELGEDTGRLHFHGIIYDVPFYVNSSVYKSLRRMNRELRHIWKFGNTWVGDNSNATANYSVKYITKLNPVDPSFCAQVFCSPGIGRCYVERLRSLGNHLTPSSLRMVHAGNRQFGCPRYYRTSLFTAYERLCDLVSQISPPPDFWRWGALTFDNYYDYVDYRDRLYSQSLRVGLSFPLKSPLATSSLSLHSETFI